MMPKFHSLLALVAITVLSLPASAQSNPQVDTLFPDQFACEPGQLLFRDASGGRIGNMIWHNGRLVTNNVGGGNQRHWLFSDPNDPSSLTVIDDGYSSSPTDQGTHAHTKTGDWICGAWGCRARTTGPGVIVW